MNQTAILRAQWLAQISETIESAKNLAQSLKDCDSTAMQAHDLYGRLEAARAEVGLLQGVRSSAIQDCDPDWLDLLGWSRPPVEPGD